MKSFKEHLVEENYHSVFYKHAGKWKHHGDYDNKADANEERHSLKNSGEKTMRLVVPKKDANWHKIDVHNYVQDRIDRGNKVVLPESRTPIT